MNYMLTRLDDFRRFLEDGRICLTNNAAERPAGGELPWTENRGYSSAPIAVLTLCSMGMTYYQTKGRVRAKDILFPMDHAQV
jgi:hypothetical protein